MAQVFRLDLWMSTWGAASPKRSSLWSNSRIISGFWKAVKLNLKKQAGNARGKPTTKKYIDKAGRKRWTGTQALTDTGNLDPLAAFFA